VEEDEVVAIWERSEAQMKGEDVGWSSLADEEGLHAPPGTTDEQLMRYLDANYDPDALAKLRFIVLTNTQVTDVAATALAKGCPGLQGIYLSNTQVTPSLAKVWSNNATTELKQHPHYGGTIADFRKQLRRVTNKNQGKGKGKKKRR
jgi:hypothetical protein